MKPSILAVASALACVAACQSPRGAPPTASTTPPPGPPPAASVTAPATTAAPAQPAASKNRPRAMGFDKGAADVPPHGFLFTRTGNGAMGRWVVRAEGDAPSKPNVLAQLDADKTSYRFPIAVSAEPQLRNVRVTVRCKAISGKVDQACGLVARYRDENNYYITRANALEDNVRLYIIRDGKRVQIASWSGKVTPNVWHEHRFDLRGDHLEVYWDGQKVLDHHDSTFADAGRAGLWTKADSVTYFDDLTIEALP